MADIAQTIQRGTEQVNQSISQLSQPAQDRTQATYMHNLSAMEQQKMKAYMTERADMITASVLTAVDAKERSISQIKKQVDDLLEKLPAEDPSMPMTPEQQAQRSDTQQRIDEVMKLYDAAIVERNTLIESISQQPGVLAAMDKSSYYNKDIGNKIFSEDVFASMPESQKKGIISQLTALQRAKTEIANRELQLEQNRKIELEMVKGAMRTSSNQLPRQPLKEGLSYDVYNSIFAREGSDIDSKKKAEWWNKDIAPFVADSPQFKDVPTDERKALHQVFTMWQPGEYSGQPAQMTEFQTVFNKYYKGIGEMTPMSARIMNTIKGIVDSENPDSRRLGAFIESIKDYVRPYETTLKPRATAEAGS